MKLSDFTVILDNNDGSEELDVGLVHIEGGKVLIRVNKFQETRRMQFKKIQELLKEKKIKSIDNEKSIVFEVEGVNIIIHKDYSGYTIQTVSHENYDNLDEVIELLEERD